MLELIICERCGEQVAVLKFPTISYSAGQPIGVNMLDNFLPAPENAYNATATSTNFTLWYAADEYDRFTGSRFAYDPYGYPYAGTMASWTYAFDGHLYLSVTGLNLPVTTFMSYYYTDYWTRLLGVSIRIIRTGSIEGRPIAG